MEKIIKGLLNRLLERQSLTQMDAESAMEAIVMGELTPAQVAGLLVALRMKGETADEIAGFAHSLRRHALQVPGVPYDVFDTCGTGGDGMRTFNISTVTALIVAACGVKVAKHGNRSVSSSCGSADALEALGVNINLTPEQAMRCLEDAGIVFLFAPHYHPAFAAVGPVRKELGVRTIFNVLGPLVNPLQPQRQIIGVSDALKAPQVADALRLLGSERAMVVRSMDGHDELTTTAVNEVYEVQDGRVQRYELDPREFGFAPAHAEDLNGGDAQGNAEIIRAVLSGNEGPRLDSVLFNSGAALFAAGKSGNIGEGVEMARKAIINGDANRLLDEFIGVSHSCPINFSLVLENNLTLATIWEK